ncbi:MAG: isoprenylcysteine carboxylmethyltransferase family protein [Thiomicrospira sp.]|jgi:protein-S-isoprenylcysteine O-methyltransferase Ste14|nr:isoprenylcysteine carboxylmethyltransferase family protein [Thiomicrospira sp.]
MKTLLPPALFVVFVVLMGVCAGFSSAPIAIYPYNFVGLAFVVIGLGVSISAKNLFKKRNTNFMTFDEPSELVTEGLFKYSRNPMYLGFAVALLGFVVLFGASVPLFALYVVFLLIVDKWYIALEEKWMLNKFGTAYEAYCKQVRKWL